MMIVCRSIITFDAYDRTVIPRAVIVFVNYFHDTAYFQLPMTPILMTLERLIATQKFKTYELTQSITGVTCLVFASWTYAILVNFASVYWPKVGVFFLTAYMHCGLTPGVIVLMIYIYRKNLKRYQQINAKTLTERYQTAENIRLLRATFNFTIITISWNVLMFGVSFVLKVQNNPAYELVVTYIWSSWDLLVAIGLFLILTVYLYSVDEKVEEIEVVKKMMPPAIMPSIPTTAE
uniref:G protein-coupled receptor n=1 Tax=Panagrellus redivivus TaxID=6233 RepID=A0A7E4UYX8_PANRE